MNYVDITAIAIIIGTALYGLNKGLIRSVFSVASTLLSLVVAYLVYPMATALMNEMGLHSIVGKGISDALGLTGLAHMNTEAILTQMHLPVFLKDFLLGGNTIETYAKLGADSAVSYISSLLTSFLLSTLSMIAVFLFAKIFLHYAAMALDLIAKLPLISSFNKLGGLLFGLMQGIIFCWLVFALLIAFCSVNKTVGAFLTEQIDNSMIKVFYYEGNLIVKNLLSVK